MEAPISQVQLFVRPIPPQAQHSEVEDFFSSVGPLKELRMMPGYVFVEYESAEVADSAFKQLSEMTFMDAPLQVEFAKEKPSYAKKGEFRVKVSNLPAGTAWQDFKDFLREEIKVQPTFVRIPPEEPTICHLEFGSKDELESAIAALNDSKFNDFQLSAEEDTSPYIASASRGFRGGFRGGRGRGGFRGGFRGGYSGGYGGRPYPPPGGFNGYPPRGGYDGYPPRGGGYPPRGGYGGPSPMGGPGGYGSPRGGYGGGYGGPRGGYGGPRGGYGGPRGGYGGPRGGYGGPRGGYGGPRYPPRDGGDLPPPPSGGEERGGDHEYRERDMGDVPSYQDSRDYERDRSPGRY